ncbi:DUF305 domain-containing protein [Streptomyces sp. NPDC053755]|uniref:DUF305 domain-containing protein n=1 Tax=Streptomyces sp. NPDC053755 TaxID=3155815 RepID=UPI0034391871
MRAFTNPTARKLAVAGAVTTAGLLLSACGSGDTSADGSGHGPDHGGKPSASATATAPGSDTAPGAFDDADVMFARMMIPHHEQALEMAGLARGRAQDAEIRRLVAEIEKAQGPEIRKMRSWLAGWGEPESAGHDGHDGRNGHGMSGMVSEQDMKDLAAARGKAFDRRFAELMIAHHEGAVEMAKAEQKNGRNSTARKLADDVVRTQSAEVEQLRGILGRL